MIPSRNFTIWIGNTGTVENPSGIVFVMKAGSTPVPVDLTGSEIIFLVRNMSGGLVLRKTSANGGITLDALAGKITIPITAPETRLMQVGARLKYEVERRISGIERTVLTGELVPAGGVNDDID
jgi:hypothetical protein